MWGMSEVRKQGREFDISNQILDLKFEANISVRLQPITQENNTVLAIVPVIPVLHRNTFLRQQTPVTPLTYTTNHPPLNPSAALASHSNRHPHLTTTMADPFEVRMKFTHQLQHLNASVNSAQKAALYALRHQDMDEDLHSCILEQLEKVEQPYFSHPLSCALSLFSSLALCLNSRRKLAKVVNIAS